MALTLGDDFVKLSKELADKRVSDINKVIDMVNKQILDCTSGGGVKDVTELARTLAHMWDEAYEAGIKAQNPKSPWLR